MTKALDAAQNKGRNWKTFPEKQRAIAENKQGSS